MMPTCAYRGCKKVADRSVGQIRYLKDWQEITFVCYKHYSKILKLLGFTVKEGEKL